MRTDKQENPENQSNEMLALLKKQVIAHRGAPRLAPENTLSSFTMASNKNLNFIQTLK